MLTGVSHFRCGFLRAFVFGHSGLNFHSFLVIFVKDLITKSVLTRVCGFLSNFRLCLCQDMDRTDEVITDIRVDDDVIAAPIFLDSQWVWPDAGMFTCQFIHFPSRAPISETHYTSLLDEVSGPSPITCSFSLICTEMIDCIELTRSCAVVSIPASRITDLHVFVLVAAALLSAIRACVIHPRRGRHVAAVCASCSISLVFSCAKVC